MSYLPAFDYFADPDVDLAEQLGPHFVLVLSFLLLFSLGLFGLGLLLLLPLGLHLRRDFCNRFLDLHFLFYISQQLPAICISSILAAS